MPASGKLLNFSALQPIRLMVPPVSLLMIPMTVLNRENEQGSKRLEKNSLASFTKICPQKYVY